MILILRFHGKVSITSIHQNSLLILDVIIMDQDGMVRLDWHNLILGQEHLEMDLTSHILKIYLNLVLLKTHY